MILTGVMQKKRYFVSMTAVIGTAVGSALGMKAAIGVTVWDALASTIAKMTGSKIGTIGMVLNIGCFLGQLLLLGKKFRKSQYFQFVVVVFNRIWIPKILPLRKFLSVIFTGDFVVQFLIGHTYWRFQG